MDDHLDFKTILENNWAPSLNGHGKQLQLAVKLEYLQKVLKSLNLKEFGHLSEKAEAARIFLQEVRG